MCQAQATLAYGLTVRAAPLYFAVKAWPRSEPVLHFFDLIFLRRCKGSLTSSLSNNAITRVPDEVWEEIRSWLVLEEIADREDCLINQLFCDDPRCTSRPPLSKRANWVSFRSGECSRCKEEIHEWTTEEFYSWSKDLLKGIRQLLAGFGLDHPLLRPVSIDPGNWDFSDSLALIAAPAQLREHDSDRELQPAIVEAACRGDWGPDEQTVVDVSFALPRNVDQRFIRFIRFFNFDVISSSVNRLSSKSGHVKEDEESSEKKSKKGKFSGVQSKGTNKIRPRWRLWMTCISEW
ncbi:hypothetical protein JCM5353_003169 [Sporobolomyces roseus]